MRSNRKFLIPLLLFLLSFLLRLALLSRGPYHVDGLALAIEAEKTFNTQQLHFLFGPGYPLTVLTGALFVGIFKIFSVNDPVMAVNFMSAVFGAACVPLLYLIVRRMFNGPTAVFSSVALSLLPTFFALSTYGKNHTQAIFFLLLGIFFILRYRESKNIAALLWAGLSLGFLGATRIQDMLLMLIPLSVLFWRGIDAEHDSQPTIITKNNLCKTLWALWTIAALTVLLFHVPFLLQSTNNHYQNQFSNFFQIGLTANYLGISPRMLSFSLFLTAREFTVPGIICSLLGLALLSRDKRRTLFFLLLWIIVPIAFYGNLRTTVPRFLVISFIPLAIALGYFVSQVIRSRPKTKYLVVILFSVLICFPFLKIYPTLSLRHTHEQLPRFSRWVGQKTPKNARIITADEALFIEYYARRSTLPQLHSMTAPVRPEELAEYKNRVDQLLSQGIPVYIIVQGAYQGTIYETFNVFIENNYDLINVGDKAAEDWHRGEHHWVIGRWTLFQIAPKASAGH